MENKEKYFDTYPYDITKAIKEEKNPAWSYINLNKVETVFQMLKLPKGSKVLDLGCGTGFASLIYPKFRLNGIEVISIDISAESIQLAKEYAKKNGINQTFMVGDAFNLPFVDDYFDGVFCIGLLHHIKEHKKVIKEMARVGQKVCCVEPNAINPHQILYQKTKSAKLAGDTKAFYLKGLFNDFNSVGLKNIETERINFILPSMHGKTLDSTIKLQSLINKIPILNYMCGSLAIYGDKLY